MSQLNNQNELEIFQKKKNLVQDLKDKLEDFFSLRKNFLFWEFKIDNTQIKDSIGNYILFTLISLVFCLPLVFWGIMNEKAFLTSVISGILSMGNAFLLRNLKIGYLKNRYKKYIEIQKQITNIVKDSTNIFTIILDNEKYLKSLEQQFSQNEEIKKIVKEKTNAILEEMKLELANLDNTENSLFDLYAIINKTEESKTELLKFVNTYELNQKYLQFKKENGLIENLEEEKLLENKLLKFKSIL